MYHHLPNGTCMVCNKSYTNGYYKQIGKKLVCSKCVILNMILSGTSDEELKAEKSDLARKPQAIYRDRGASHSQESC